LSPYKWESVGASPLNSAGGGMSTTSNVFVSFTGGPSIVVPRSGEYRIWGTIFMATQAAGLSGLQGGLAVNGVVQGTTAGGQAYVVAQTTFDGGVMPFEIPLLALAAGATLTMKVATSGAMSTQFQAGCLNVEPFRVQ
jgi:hypothetical protein